MDQKYLAECFVFFLMGSRHAILGWLGTHCGDQAGLNLMAVLLPLLPKCEISGVCHHACSNVLFNARHYTLEH